MQDENPDRKGFHVRARGGVLYFGYEMPGHVEGRRIDNSCCLITNQMQHKRQARGCKLYRRPGGGKGALRIRLSIVENAGTCC
jgi:hypothetical protein